MKQVKLLFLALAMSLGLVAIPAALPVYAVEVFEACDDIENSAVCDSSDDDELPSMAMIIVNTMLFVLGLAAVVMIVIGGIYYATSGGDAAKVKTGKETILYSVVGLIIALLAFSIVNFVIGRF
jgi:hypothetical protein